MWCFQHLTWKCASRQNGVHFLDMSTSKSAPRMVCFVHFDFAMCFAPQRRAIFSSLIWPDGSAPEPTFRSSIIGKKQCFATFLPCRAPASSFFGLFLFSDLLSTDSFSSLTLPISAFPSAHTVGSLTSKPPSDIYICINNL